jgi:hypothetical protein
MAKNKLFVPFKQRRFWQPRPMIVGYPFAPIAGCFSLFVGAEPCINAFDSAPDFRAWAHSVCSSFNIAGIDFQHPKLPLALGNRRVDMCVMLLSTRRIGNGDGDATLILSLRFGLRLAMHRP